jgi:bacterioferritin
MTHDEFIALLNEDLITEYQAIVQYNAHIATLSGAEYVSTLSELGRHLTQEPDPGRPGLLPRR